MRFLSRLAFIFDVDGVLIDSNRLHAECWEAYLGGLGVRMPAGFAERMFGRHNDAIVRDLFGPDLSAEEVFGHGAAKEALFRQMLEPVLAEYLAPGLLPFLARYPNVPKGVASNAEPANIAFVLDHGGLRSHFQVVLDGQQVAKPKPDPEIYLRAAELLGFRPGDCVVFEDSHSGVQAALAAGACVVGLTTTYDTLPGLELAIPDFLDPRLDAWLRARLKTVTGYETPK